MSEHLMLAKTYKTDKNLIFPLYVSEKLDGVPVCISCDTTDGVHAVSRQGNRVYSIDHILDTLDGLLPIGCKLIGELYIPGEDFKTISGLVRRNKSCHETSRLEIHVYDYLSNINHNLSFIDRKMEMYRKLPEITGTNSTPVKCIPQDLILNKDELDRYVTKFNTDNQNAEGLMLRACDGPASLFKAGWRSPGMLKMKTTCDIDLPIHSIEEAFSASGTPLGMVGRINVIYIKDVEDGNNHHNIYNIIGVGPGKMTHEERKKVWKDRNDYLGKYIEIKYMPDNSYNALREPRFYRFREDKDE